MNKAHVIFLNEAKEINQHFAELNYQEESQGLPTVTGDLFLRDETGTVIDSYSIKIVAGNGFPFRFPLVYETGGRIPVNIDWHVFSDGHCCIKAMPEEILLSKRGITLSYFIREQVIPYFFNQKHRELHGFFLRERSHNEEANLQFFKEHFKTNDANLVLRLLTEAQMATGRKSNSKCLCGSGRKYKKCHRRAVRATTAYSNSEMSYFIHSINSLTSIN